MSDWKNKKLREIATIDRNSIQPENIQNGTEYLGLEHIESGGKIVGRETVQNGELASSKFQFTSAHILYGKLRPYLGKIAAPKFDGICSTDILPILPGPDLDRMFLCYFLRQPALVDFATAKSSGANLPRLSPKSLEKFEIPFPPLDEQKRIAEVLDRAEALRARRRAALALLDELTQSIFLDMFGDPLPNPRGWETVKLKEVLKLITYGLTVRPKYVPDGIPLISGKEIRGGTIDFDAAAKMSEGDFDGLSDKVKPAANDVLFSKTGSIGHTALVDTERVFALAQNVARLTFDAAKVNNVFALHFLRSTSVQLLAQRSVRGNAVKDLQLGVMGDFPFILPPLESQCGFAKRIGALSELSLTHQRAMDGCDELFAALQSRAFRGEL